MKDLPFVSIVIPTKNEEKLIKECMDKLLNQDYPQDKFEIIVVDESNDGTAKVVNEYCERYGNRVRLLYNERDGVGLARRTGVDHSKGDVIVDFSAHGAPERNFLSCLVTTLMKCKKDVAGVGCKHAAHPEDPLMAKSMFTAMTSFFGGAGTAEVCPKKEGYVYAVIYNAYWKSAIEAIGGYPSGDDIEFHILLKEAGYRHYFTPKTTVYFHWKRSTNVISLLKRMILLGRLRIREKKKHPRSFKVVYALPSLLVTLFVSTLILYALVPRSLITTLFFMLMCTYLVTAAISSLIVSVRSRHLNMLPLLFLSYLIIHFGYGFGFIYGLLETPDHH